MRLIRSPDATKCSQRLFERRVNDVYSIHSPSEQKGTSKQAKSRRQRKSASKNSKGSSAPPKSAKLLYKGTEMQMSEIFVFGLRRRKRAEMKSNEISAFGRDICNVPRCKRLRSCREDRGLYLLPCFGLIREV
ncbi:hypothetical protein Nepgr_030790 [Nepenthes gracilis]|uniref:Uncharacterized protein n=1 Tax=Nepenthes gracilis TaxID=150966 RepID=A0AAD3Y452_NEPGR|nr:hypothetical protein Nepgr_030790 [Nepenthes gracilis]